MRTGGQFRKILTGKETRPESDFRAPVPEISAKAKNLSDKLLTEFDTSPELIAKYTDKMEFISEAKRQLGKAQDAESKAAYRSQIKSLESEIKDLFTYKAVGPDGGVVAKYDGEYRKLMDEMFKASTYERKYDAALRKKLGESTAGKGAVTTSLVEGGDVKTKMYQTIYGPAGSRANELHEYMHYQDRAVATKLRDKVSEGAEEIAGKLSEEYLKFLEPKTAGSLRKYIGTLGYSEKATPTEMQSWAVTLLNDPPRRMAFSSWAGKEGIDTREVMRDLDRYLKGAAKFKEGVTEEGLIQKLGLTQKSGKGAAIAAEYLGSYKKRSASGPKQSEGKLDYGDTFQRYGIEEEDARILKDLADNVWPKMSMTELKDYVPGLEIKPVKAGIELSIAGDKIGKFMTDDGARKYVLDWMRSHPRELLEKVSVGGPDVPVFKK
jgi:hypothetical protein